MEKVIREFRVIETEDGFRVEIKGDKEKLKSFMRGFEASGWWGPHGRRPGRRHGWGPFAFGLGPMMWEAATACCGPWEVQSEREEEAEGTANL